MSPGVGADVSDAQAAIRPTEDKMELLFGGAVGDNMWWYFKT